MPVDWRLFAYVAVLVTLTTIVVGVAPLWQAFRVSVIRGTGTPQRGVGFRRWSLRGVLITAQIAMSTVLLVATTLFVRSLWNASRIYPGFDMAHVVTIEADTRSRQLTAAEVGTYYRTAIERLKDRPNVVAVSGAIVVPLSMNSIVNSLFVDIGGKDQAVTVNTNWILPDYFRAMGIPLAPDGNSATPTEPRSFEWRSSMKRSLAVCSRVRARWANECGGPGRMGIPSHGPRSWRSWPTAAI